MANRGGAREDALAFIGLTAAEATLIDPRLSPEPSEANCRLTIVPGRLLIAPHRAARRKGLEEQEYAWPVVALLPVKGRFGSGPEVTPLLIDISGQLATLYVEAAADVLTKGLQDCGFQVIEAPFVAEGRQAVGLRTAWVPEDLRPLLPVSLFTRP